MSIAEDQAKRARAASVSLRKALSTAKSAAIRAMGARLKSRLDEVLAANKADVEQAKTDRLSDAKIDRLRLDEKRIDELTKALDAVADQPDPVGKVVDGRKAPSGIICKRVRVPMGVI